MGGGWERKTCPWFKLLGPKCGRQLPTPHGQAALTQPGLPLGKSMCQDQALLPPAWPTVHEERSNNTESQSGSGWKGPQWLTWSILPAQAGFP